MNGNKQIMGIVSGLFLGITVMTAEVDRKVPAEWQFNSGDSLKTWKVSGVVEHSIGAEGLSLVSGKDSVILAPKLNFPAEDVVAVEVVMKSDKNSHGQIFFSTDKTKMSEQSSYRFQVRAGEDFQTYRIDCGGNPLWAGTIVDLRLDPVDNYPDIKVIVKSLRLIMASAK